MSGMAGHSGRKMFVATPEQRNTGTEGSNPLPARGAEFHQQLFARRDDLVEGRQGMMGAELGLPPNEQGKKSCS